MTAAFLDDSNIWQVDLDDQTFSDLPMVLRLALWSQLGKPPPVVVSRTLDEPMLKAAYEQCKKRDHRMWIEEQLRRHDACGRGEELRQAFE